jgi:hypothetical protein
MVIGVRGHMLLAILATGTLAPGLMLCSRHGMVLGMHLAEWVGSDTHLTCSE